MEQGIPRRIIQTGRSRDLSLTARASAASMRSLNPGFEFLFFDDRAVVDFVEKEFPEYRELFESFPHRIQRYDFFRYLAVFRLGGFYFDLDVFLASPLDKLLAHRCVFPFEELTLNRFLRSEFDMDWEIGNYAFATVPGHPFLEVVIQNCARAQRDPAWVTPMLGSIPALFRPAFYVLNTTGPGLLSRSLAENPSLHADITVLFPEDVCDEESWHAFGNYGVHLMDGSWRDKRSFVYRWLANFWEKRERTRLMRESLTTGRTRTLGDFAKRKRGSQ